ncbi:MAG: DJ-1/PfpI family protein [Elusimicrobiota bacterium]|jgi:protease I|nr:DJ-1/PfpI family protein [Elusimicrobiota bacterium]
MKKAVFVTAPELFRDEEYFQPKEILEKSGVEVTTASLKKGELKGSQGATTTADITIDEIKLSDFDIITFIGGGGASVYFENKKALDLANSFYEAGKTVSSICIAGVILANSGILKDKKATAFIDGKDALIKGGAKWTGKDVEVDGKIITANGPAAAKAFGKAIVEAV